MGIKMNCIGSLHHHSIYSNLHQGQSPMERKKDRDNLKHSSHCDILIRLWSLNTQLNILPSYYIRHSAKDTLLLAVAPRILSQ